MAVTSSASAPRLSDPYEQQRIVVQLQQETMLLRAELERLRCEQENLVEMAYTDPLTGLANRRAFDRELQREWELSKRDEIDSFVVIADLDGFKQLNDSFGHAAGDDLLRRFGDALALASRRTDVAARIGGDEFAVLLVRCDECVVQCFRRRLQAAMAVSVGVSLGHASLRSSDSPATALDRADLAMLASKRSRRRRRRVPLRAG